MFDGGERRLLGDEGSHHRSRWRNDAGRGAGHELETLLEVSDRSGRDGRAGRRLRRRRALGRLVEEGEAEVGVGVERDDRLVVVRRVDLQLIVGQAVEHVHGGR